MTRTIQKLLPIVSVDPDQELIEYLETVLEVPGEHLMVPAQDQREAPQMVAVLAPDLMVVQLQAMGLEQTAVITAPDLMVVQLQVMETVQMVVIAALVLLLVLA